MKTLINISLVALLLVSCKKEVPSLEISYTGENLRFINCPLGGIGTGDLLISGYGSLHDIEIFNRASMDELPPYMTFFSLFTKDNEGNQLVRVMEREFLNEYPNPFGKPRQQLGGLPRFKEAVFHNMYPIIDIDLIDAEVPLDVSMHAWSPFIPVDTQNSGLPGAVIEWELINTGKNEVNYSIAFSMGNPFKTTDKYGKPTRVGCTILPVDGATWKALEFSTPVSDSLLPDNGSLRVSFPSKATISTPLYSGAWWDDAQLFWNDFSKDGELHPRLDTSENINENIQSAAMNISGTLAPGESVSIPFIFNWFIPYRQLETSQAFGNSDVENAIVRNYYSTQFSGISQVASYFIDNLEMLHTKTEAFSHLMQSSTVPLTVKDAAISNMAALKTNLIMRDEHGNVHGFEGLGNNFGCCPGNCTHVWNYAQTMAALFPSLEQNVRETGFGISTHENGYQCFRTVFPLSENWFKSIAADGQMGNIIRAYREWKMSGDNFWLGEIWPDVKNALEYAWKGNGELKKGFEWMNNCPVPWDPFKEGVLRGDQHNTYDINFYGPNMMTGSLYLGALKACSEMAMAMNEPQKSIEYLELYKKGVKRYQELLWNGEYYTQKVEVIDGLNIPERLKSPPDKNGKVIPKYQFGEGCLSDQLLGQYLSFVSGLGYVMDTNSTRKALESIYRYNFKEHMDKFENVQRIYAANDEAGLVICTWPGGNKPILPFVYADEVWTGVEYQVATSLIFAGLVDEGLNVASGVRSRYKGSNRNPFAEIESGRFYARSLASWGVYQAMAGYQYDGTKKIMKFSPAVDVLPMRYFWSSAEAWGSIEISRANVILKCEYGNLNLRELILKGRSFFVLREYTPSVEANISYTDETMYIRFPNVLNLSEGQDFKMLIPGF